MKLVYIAGKFRAPNPWLVEQHVRIAETWMMRVWELGAVGVCPHAMGRFTDKAIPDNLVLDGTLELMRRCDAVFMVPENWKQSEGAILERQEAIRRAMLVFYHLSEVKAWLEGSNAS
jgi:hypothetical protein